MATVSPSSYDQLLARFAAIPAIDGTHFRVWAPEARALQMVLRDGGSHSLLRQAVLSEDCFILRFFFTDPAKGELDRFLVVNVGPYLEMIHIVVEPNGSNTVELRPTPLLHRMAGTSQKKQRFCSLPLRLYTARASS
jgi:hypothetical protein